MTLQSAIEAELPFLRAEAEARMQSRVTIRRKTGALILDQDGFEVPEWETVATDVPFRLGGASRGPASSRNRNEAGGVDEQGKGYGNLPHDWADLADDDHLDIAVGENAGRVLRVVEASLTKDQGTARRFNVEHVDRPAEW